MDEDRSRAPALCGSLVERHPATSGVQRRLIHARVALDFQPNAGYGSGEPRGLIIRARQVRFLPPQYLGREAVHPSTRAPLGGGVGVPFDSVAQACRASRSLYSEPMRAIPGARSHSGHDGVLLRHEEAVAAPSVTLGRHNLVTAAGRYDPQYEVRKGPLLRSRRHIALAMLDGNPLYPKLGKDQPVTTELKKVPA